MTERHPIQTEPQTESEFGDRLAALLRAASENGINVAGGWSVPAQNMEEPDWGVEIYPVEDSR